MELDYKPPTMLYTLTVPRAGEADIAMYMNEYGLDFSLPASTPEQAVFITGSPYAAATFAEHATPLAMSHLAPIVAEIDLSRALDSKRHIDFPDDEELAPFQLADLEYGLKRTRFLCADEPGLGKTPIAIAYANEIQAKRVLVIVPANIRFQWCQRIERFSTMGITYQVPNPLIYAVQSGKYGVNEDAAWIVVSYDLARTPGILNALRKVRFDLGIFDEVHMAKTMGARRSRALWGGGNDPLFAEALADCCERVVCLSGTPMPNRPREIYSLARHLNFQSVDWLSEEKFIERYNPIEERWVQRKKDKEWVLIKDERSGRHAELQNRLRAHIMSRHLKREVLTQLKLPEYDLIRVEETASVKAALKAESLLGIDPEDLEGTTFKLDGHITTARRLMGEAIAPQCTDWMKMLLEGGEEKLLLFYWFIENGNIVERALTPWLERHKKYLVRVDGSTGNAKQGLVDTFIEDPACAVLMGNVLTLGTGTDGIQAVCSHALIMEPDWVPGNNVQCIDRVDRWGQKHTVQADIFVAPNSIVEKTLASALRKARVTHNSLDRRYG